MCRRCGIYCSVLLKKASIYGCMLQGFKECISLRKSNLTILTSSILEKLLTKTLTYTRDGPSKNMFDIFLFLPQHIFTSCIEPRGPDPGIIDIGAENIVQDLLFNLSIIRLLGHFVPPRENISFRPGMVI